MRVYSGITSGLYMFGFWIDTWSNGWKVGAAFGPLFLTMCFGTLMPHDNEYDWDTTGY